MDKLLEIEKTLEQLHKDFNEQVVTLSSDTREFHNSLIVLTSKYPEHKELIQFIVLINDKLETNQHTFGEVVVDSFNELMLTKRELVKEIIVSKKNMQEIIHKYHPLEEKGSIISDITKRVKSIKMSDVKTVLVYIMIILITFGIIADVSFTEKILILLSKVFGG